jgi:hypothetical protein
MQKKTKFAALLLFAAAVSPCFAQQPLPPGFDGPLPQPAPARDDNPLPLRERSLFENGSERPAAFTLVGQFMTIYDDDIRGAYAPGGGALAQISLFASYDKNWRHNEFHADYTPTFNRYFSDGDLNFTAQDYDQEFIHRISERSEVDWSARAARYSSRYLAPVDPTRFGDLTITVPDLQSLSGVNDITVTTVQSRLAYVHQSSTRDTWTFAALGGISKFTPENSATIFTPLVERFYDGGANLSWRHKLSEKQSFGVSVTTAYTAQSGPTTHELDETIQGTFSQMIGRWRFDLAAGPLIRQVPKSSPFKNGNNYVVNVGATRKFGHSTVNAFYSRSLQMGFVDGSVLAHSISGSVRHDLSERLFVGALGTYGYSSYPGASLNGFISAGQFGYHVTRDLIAIASYTHGQQDAEGNLAQLGYHRNQYSGGISYDFTHLLPHRN